MFLSLIYKFESRLDRQKNIEGRPSSPKRRHRLYKKITYHSKQCVSHLPDTYRQLKESL